MMMAHEVLGEVPQELPVYCYETGRIGVKHKQTLSGTLLLTEVVNSRQTYKVISIS